jgi:hypothetical protein
MTTNPIIGASMSVRSSVMQTTFLLCLGMLAGIAHSADMSALNEHRAACVAALTTKAEPLVTQLKGGDRSVEPELLSLTQKGFAIIGAAYKDGLRKPEADQLLDAAKKAQKSMPSAELVRLQSTCQVEGAKVLTDVSGLERYLLTSAAERRVARIVDKSKKR